MSDPGNYNVGWICALQTEYVAARVFLDETHAKPILSSSDSNHYTVGKMGDHNVVIAVLPQGVYGISSATAVIKDLLHSFKNLKFALMVGVGGGSPSRHDIRLGDIVVSKPGNEKGGVVQYDFGKTIQEQEFQYTGFLNQPPSVLLTAMAGLSARYEMEGNNIQVTIDEALKKFSKLRRKYQRPDSASDRLYRSTVVHSSDKTDETCATLCGDHQSKIILRIEREEDEDNPAVHYGLIASANQLMKDAEIRDKLAADMDVLCFEMEAAGLMNQFPCLVIRGICDYSDSHKNKDWQGYAAMTAAAYAKDLLSEVNIGSVRAERSIAEALESS
ncbi:hypothetical protein TWF730_008234 [Orbilia blumenaviensis]|uniref:Nucleoside phosphorylase domain-containing protein n=1 Tax=Orbilia blumenaviensis TaxID=1796055 RepID=A0AAV9V4R7_9PEZI